MKRKLTRVLIGYPAPSERDADFYPMLLLNQAIAGAPTLDTILMRELRLKRGLVYDVSSSYEHTAYRGRIVVEFETQPKYAGKAAGIVFGEFERLRSAGISAADLAVAKRRMFLYELGAPTSLDVLADRLVDVASGIDSQAYVDDLANRCAAVAPSRLREVAKHYFAARDRAVVYEGN